MSYSLFKSMCDEDLRERIAKLERKVEELREANTTIALRMFEQFAAALEAARTELNRRRAC